MELEFDVRITANILYDYMLRHTYYSASGLLGTVAGALMMVYYFSQGGVIFLIAGQLSCFICRGHFSSGRNSRW